MINLNKESDSGIDMLPNLTGFLDLMSILALFFILLASALFIDASENSTAANSAKEKELKLASLLDDKERRLKKSIIELNKERNKYNVLSDDYKELLKKMENFKIKKFIIPNKIKGVIFFKSGSAKIQERFKKELSRYFSEIKAFLDTGDFSIVQIEGHTDDVQLRPNSIYRTNWELGAARAIAVAKYFISEMKIDPSKIFVSSYSEYLPLVKATTSDARGKNRRIEITLYKNYITGELK